MRYQAVVPGRFVSRPNRFIAHVEVDGSLEVCHVKNTGRCRELLTPGAAVYLEPAGNPARKTKYDLIAVEKNGLLINMDAQAPNKAFGEWAAAGGFLPGLTLIRPEFTWEDSRFDFRLEDEQGPHGAGRQAPAGPAAGSGAGVPGGGVLRHSDEGRHPLPAQRRHRPGLRLCPAGGRCRRRGSAGVRLPGNAGRPDAGRACAGAAGLTTPAPPSGSPRRSR